MFLIIPYGIDYFFRRTPRGTIALIAICVIVFLIQLAIPESDQLAFALYPGEHFNPLQILSSAFMHADIWHLAFNMLYLWVFGRYMEERVGTIAFVAYYLLFATGSALLYVVAETSGLPAIGASGAISGVQGFVMAAAWRARVKLAWFFMYLWVPRYGIAHLDAWVIVGIWFAADAFFLLMDMQQDVALLAHLGGFGTGAIVAWVLRFGMSASSRWRLADHESAEEAKRDALADALFSGPDFERRRAEAKKRRERGEL